MLLENDSFRAPAFLSSALINNDMSSLKNDVDKRMLRRVRAWLVRTYGPTVNVVSCEDESHYSWNFWGNVTRPHYNSLGGELFGGECLEYNVLYNVESNESQYHGLGK